MTQMGGSVFEIRDVVYGFIQLDEQEWDIINHPVTRDSEELNSFL